MKPIVSPNIRVRCGDFFEVGAGSIVDDFCYFSTRVRIGRCTHIANGCSVAGGAERLFTIGDFCSLSAGVRIWCSSDDFVNDLVSLGAPGMDTFKDHLIVGDVHLGNYTAVGSNSVVMPDNEVPEGTVIGALSFVPPNFRFSPWMVYAGTPIREIRQRNRANVMRQVDLVEAALRDQ